MLLCFEIELNTGVNSDVSPVKIVIYMYLLIKNVNLEPVTSVY